MSASTSRRSALPKRRRRSSISMATSRSSASSSSRARSALRVTRKAWWWPIVMPGNSESRWAAMTCSSGTKRSPSGMTTKRGRAGGHLDPGDAALPRRPGPAPRPPGSARGSRCTGTGGRGRRPAGSARGRSGAGRRRRGAARSSSSREDQLAKRMPASARPGTMQVEEDVVLAPDQLLDPAPDHRQLLAGPQPVDRAGAHAGGHLVLEGGDPYLVELVEQLGEDGEELRPLQQGDAVVLGQVEQAGAEVEARLLPVGEALVPERLDLLVGRRGRRARPPPRSARRAASARSAGLAGSARP